MGHRTTATDDGGVSSKQLKPSHVRLHHGVDELVSVTGTLIWRVQHVLAAEQHSSQLVHSSVVKVAHTLATDLRLLMSGTIICISTTTRQLVSLYQICCACCV